MKDFDPNCHGHRFVVLIMFQLLISKTTMQQCYTPFWHEAVFIKTSLIWLSVAMFGAPHMIDWQLSV